MHQLFYFVVTISIQKVEEDVLKEGLISVGTKQEAEPDRLDPEIIKRLDNLFQYNPISPAYYQDEEEDNKHLEKILAWYKDYYSDKKGGASLLVPIGALRLLRKLLRVSGGRSLVISGDKGHNNPDQFRGISDPHIAVHGSFSVMVNYHAIGMYFTCRGGFALHNPQEEASLKVSCFVSTGDSAESEEEGAVWTGDSIEQRDSARSQEYPFLVEAFNENLDTFGPNDFFVLQVRVLCVGFYSCADYVIRAEIHERRCTDTDTEGTCHS